MGMPVAMIGNWKRSRAAAEIVRKAYGNAAAIAGGPEQQAAQGAR
jgi:hypothetical protein